MKTPVASAELNSVRRFPAEPQGQEQAWLGSADPQRRKNLRDPGWEPESEGGL